MNIQLDTSRCSGCRVCEIICALYHFRENNPRKARVKIRGRFPSPGKYEVSFCDQCGRCAEVCPVGAIYEQEGIYYINADKCTSCYVCVDECPRQALFIIDEASPPIKCDLCGECIALCPREVFKLSKN